VAKNGPTLVKKFALAGLFLAEVYMVLTVAGPRLHGEPIPMDSLVLRMAALALLFGPFGLAVGTGVGLLVDGGLRMLGKNPPGNRDLP
jgi:hypothetical protein